MGKTYRRGNDYTSRVPEGDKRQAKSRRRERSAEQDDRYEDWRDYHITYPDEWDA